MFFLFVCFLLIHIFREEKYTHMNSETSREMKTHWTLILQWEQPKIMEKGKGKDPKPNKEWKRSGEALGSGNCVPAQLCLCVFRVLADGSAVLQVFFLINVSDSALCSLHKEEGGRKQTGNLGDD